MGFSEFPAWPTRYRLGDVWLSYCSFDYPVLRRGAEPVRITFYQHGDLYEKLKQLQDAGGTTELVIEESDRNRKKRVTTIKGIIVANVYKEHDGIDGVRVTITDLRDLIDTMPWTIDINLVVNGFLVEGTYDPNLNFAWNLAQFLRDTIFLQNPFRGNMDSNWLREAGQTEPNTLPFDGHYSGGKRSEVLEKLLAMWGKDLVFHANGKFSVARRVTADGKDPGVDQLKKLDMEWAEREPEFGKRSSDFLRARQYRVPYWEYHNLEVWYNPPAQPGKTVSGIPAFSGLELFPVYKAFEDYFSFRNLFEAAGLAWSRDIENTIRRKFLEKGMPDTIISTHSRNLPVSDHPRRLMLQNAVTDAERQVFQIRRALNPPVGAPFGGGPGEWLDIQLGRRRPDGTIVDARAHGDWTLLFDKPTIFQVPSGTAIDTGPFGGDYKKEVLRYRTVIIRGYIFDDSSATIVEGVILTPNFLRYPTPDNTTLKTDPPPIGSTNSQLEAAAYRHKMRRATPFAVTWEGDKSALIVRLKPDERDIGKNRRAILGKPAANEYLDFKGGGRAIPWVKSVISQNAPRKKVLQNEFEKASAELVESAQLSGIATNEGMLWSLEDLSFNILVNARRNFPNDERKFYMVNVDGFSDAPIDIITLLPTDRVYMQRNYASLEGNPKFEADQEDGFGTPMNLEEVQADGSRRVAEIMARATDPEPVSHAFFNIKALEKIKITGSLDQVVLRVRGPRVECELHTGPRADDRARLIEAELQRNRALADYHGKVAKN